MEATHWNYRNKNSTHIFLDILGPDCLVGSIGRIEGAKEQSANSIHIGHYKHLQHKSTIPYSTAQSHPHGILNWLSTLHVSQDLNAKIPLNGQPVSVVWSSTLAVQACSSTEVCSVHCLLHPHCPPLLAPLHLCRWCGSAVIHFLFVSWPDRSEQCQHTTRNRKVALQYSYSRDQWLDLFSSCSLLPPYCQ